MRLAPNFEFHMYVGFCITAWAAVDEALFNICADVLGTKREIAAVVYYRTTTLGARVGLLDELVPQVLPHPERKSGGHPHADLKAWRELSKEINALLEVRTQIAHHPVDSKYELKPRLDKIESGPPNLLADYMNNRSYQIYASHNERLRKRHSKQSPLTMEHLSEHCQMVQRLARVLVKYQGKLQAHL